jgi:hypothetical protein
VAEKQGLTMWLAFPRSDYSTLRSVLEKEWGKPDQDSRLHEETVVWNNGVSRIELQREAGSRDNTSSAMVHQTKYFDGMVVYVMQKKIEANNKLLKKKAN